ncbi:cytochrome P450 [Coniophora puteana RWD-64-598 SS2]|uniref:Cytochrome P450 n=1 Tax=Coniophora puteana (strain RWD-64-598) TaxID=741705 RepID=A0A5M3N346_CONPW|nr:cytochrome P450 [Coniophora puteana RWD-64-598 SS2]EIW85707.1 cytochrome P450 [Coniophora puteana RWD-64-598 SS2]
MTDFYTQGPAIVGVSLVLGVCAYQLISRDKAPRNSQPPGPRGLPFIGSALDVNPADPSSTFVEWERKYGELIRCRHFGRDLFIINSERIAQDLFERRSRIYSDRAGFSALEPYGVLFNVGMVQYGDTWRMHRKLMNGLMRRAAIPNHHDSMTNGARILVSRLKYSPERHLEHYDGYAASSIMHIVYGHDLEKDQEEIVQVLSQTASCFVEKTSDAFVALVNMFPLLKYVPAWFPGGAKFNAAKSRETISSLVSTLYGMLLRQAPEARSSYHVCAAIFVGKVETRSPTYVNADIAVPLAGGLETTSSMLSIFVMAMMLFPEAQKRAQAEIDRVLKGRPPTFEDRSSLPYVEAVMREVMRWGPVVPLGVPHCALEDDVYEGYFIPQGTVLIAHAGSMLRNSVRYPNPEKFYPERFLNEDGSLNNEDMGYVFGFGRRICPGRYLADASVWIAMVSILAELDIKPAVDDDGNELVFKPEWIHALTSRPKPFPCCIFPRI